MEYQKSALCLQAQRAFIWQTGNANTIDRYLSDSGSERFLGVFLFR
jgi:hypothetical protein